MGYGDPPIAGSGAQPSPAERRDERRTKAAEAATGAFVSLCQRLESLIVIAHRLAEQAECDVNEERNRRVKK